LKGSPLDSAFAFANHFADPAVNEQYNMNLGSGPTHPEAKANPQLADWYYPTAEEIEKYAHIPDYAYLGTKKDEWNARWEKEVVPLMRG